MSPTKEDKLLILQARFYTKRESHRLRQIIIENGPLGPFFIGG